MTLKNAIPSALSALALTVSLACGGGGGGNPPGPTTTAPTISAQPTNLAVTAGASATFTVTATGTAPLTYQWKKGGTAISGATSATFAIATTATSDSGSYTVTVSNSAGSVTSNAATLSVTQPTATSLAYTDPTSGTYLLKKNTTLSTGTHLVLDLVGPAGATGTGVVATFGADTAKVTWVNVASADAANTFVQNGTAFTLGAAPQILKGKVIGSSLQVVAAQKGTGNAVSLNAPLLRVALDLKASQPVGAITLTADASTSQMIDGAGTVSSITVAVGTLTAQ